MKSLGDTLKSVREERGISMDQAIHETNISRNFLEALENEEFDEFPAEAYLVGFLRNYSDFLGLDSDKMVGQYKNYKLSEEPTPIEQLVGPPKGAALRKFLPWIVLVIVIGAAGVLGIPRLINIISDARTARFEKAGETEEPLPAREVRPALPLWEGEVRPSDTLVLESDNNELRLEVGDGDGKLRFDAGSTGIWSVMLGEEIYIPDNDGRPAWRLYLKDLGLPGGGGIIEIQQLAEVLPDVDFSDAVVVSEPPSGESERRRETKVILSAAKPDRYTLVIAFRDFCLFRYKVDSQAPLESYYADGENFRLDVGRTLTLWSSNAGALYAKIGGEELSFGRRGEVAVNQIRWILNEESGAYDLTVVPMY
ncbi:MAG: helix-turn-helix domain-containing protein [Spirochaetaceae bacterium]|nr:helix-turn-helix domain-containing protein [Spirochaetaceae bacterium]